ncbi:hypothetical protein EV127DRAFT_194547 [Xylaria flabelliformis]|nr:hypothetical protein EV127DRAFT_194547 [Xylaria flabelliformis]
MASDEQLRQLGREVSRYFTRRPGVEFAGFAGIGRHGGAFILEEKNAAGQLLRKLVIKYSLGELATDEESNADDDLRNEYEWLEMLRGAEHIVRLVPFADCSLDLPGISNGEDTFEDSVAQNPTVRRCPTFALEHIPNGTLFKFTERLQHEEQLIPNRMMWRIWLCMVRQCVAMAFPPQQTAANYRPERERIIPNRRFYTLTQNSPQ